MLFIFFWVRFWDWRDSF